MTTGFKYPTRAGVAAGVAILFGMLTISSGGYVLFGGEQAERMAGHVVRFVLWFNFLAGFGYVLAGIGLVRGQRWVYWAALALAVATLVVLGAFSLHVLLGGAFEVRTFVALIARTLVLLAIAWTARNAADHRAVRAI